MAVRSMTRFAGVFFAALLLFAMVLGSMALAQLDPDLRVRRIAQVNPLPTPTLFPTLPPATATQTSLAQRTPPPAGSTPTEELSPTPTPTLAALEACTFPEGWLPYTLRTSETIEHLARRAQTSATLLLQANCWAAEPLPTAGDVLYLPPIAFAAPTPVARRCGPPATWRMVPVQVGDTLFRLALKYGTTVQAIRDANCMMGDLLLAGQMLYLPPVIVWWPTETPLPTWTPTLTPEPTEIVTPTPTLDIPTPTVVVEDPTLTPTPDPWLTPTPDPTLTPPETLEPTPTLTATADPVLEPSPTLAIPSLTPTPTITPIPSLTPTATP